MAAALPTATSVSSGSAPSPRASAPDAEGGTGSLIVTLTESRSAFYLGLDSFIGEVPILPPRWSAVSLPTAAIAAT
ncbi:MAG: hypothetical protein R2712_11550 [Vicinamibacterales bacterium]